MFILTASQQEVIDDLNFIDVIEAEFGQWSQNEYAGKECKILNSIYLASDLVLIEGSHLILNIFVNLRVSLPHD